jgi:hypothetical protein
MQEPKVNIDGMGDLSKAAGQIAAQMAQQSTATGAEKQPHFTMPENGEFLAEKDGEWLKVTRFKCPTRVAVGAVIHNTTGRYWVPEFWMPIQ